MPEWVIYYSDGSRITSDDCEPFAAPKQGVQVILVRDGRCGRRVLRMAEYYVWSPTLGRWLDCFDTAAVILRAVQEPHVTVLRGEYLREPDFERILISAHNDPDLPAVSPGSPPHRAWKE